MNQITPLEQRAYFDFVLQNNLRLKLQHPHTNLQEFKQILQNEYIKQKYIPVESVHQIYRRTSRKYYQVLYEQQHRQRVLDFYDKFCVPWTGSMKRLTRTQSPEIPSNREYYEMRKQSSLEIKKSTRDQEFVQAWEQSSIAQVSIWQFEDQ